MRFTARCLGQYLSCAHAVEATVCCIVLHTACCGPGVTRFARRAAERARSSRAPWPASIATPGRVPRVRALPWLSVPRRAPMRLRFVQRGVDAREVCMQAAGRFRSGSEAAAHREVSRSLAKGRVPAQPFPPLARRRDARSLWLASHVHLPSERAQSLSQSRGAGGRALRLVRRRFAARRRAAVLSP